MKFWIRACVAWVFVIGLAGCESIPVELEDFRFWGHDDIALSAVPENVIAAAEEAVPGIELHKAEIDSQGDGAMTIYELEGHVDGVHYEIEVAEDGTIIEIDREDD